MNTLVLPSMAVKSISHLPALFGGVSALVGRLATRAVASVVAVTFAVILGVASTAHAQPGISLIVDNTSVVAGGTATFTLISDTAPAFASGDSVAVRVVDGAGSTITYPGYDSASDSETQRTYNINANGPRLFYVYMNSTDKNKTFTLKVPNNPKARDITVRVASRVASLYDPGAESVRTLDVGTAASDEPPVVTLANMDGNRVLVGSNDRFSANLQISIPEPRTTATSVDIRYFRGTESVVTPDVRHAGTENRVIQAGNTNRNFTFSQFVREADFRSGDTNFTAYIAPSDDFTIGTPSRASFEVVAQPTLWITGPTRPVANRDDRFGIEVGKNATFTLHSDVAPASDLVVRLSSTGSGIAKIYNTTTATSAVTDVSNFNVILPKGATSVQFHGEAGTSPFGTASVGFQAGVVAGSGYTFDANSDYPVVVYRLPNVIFATGTTSANVKEGGRLRLILGTTDGNTFPADTHVTLRVRGAVGTITYPVDKNIFPDSPYTEAPETRNENAVDYEVFIPRGQNMAIVDIYVARFNTGDVVATLIAKDDQYYVGQGGTDTSHTVDIDTQAPGADLPLSVAFGEELVLENRRAIPFTITRASGGEQANNLLRYQLAVSNRGNVQFRHIFVPESGIGRQEMPHRGGDRSFEGVHPVGTNRAVHGYITIGQDSKDTDSGRVTLQIRPVSGNSNSAVSNATVTVGDVDPIVNIHPQNWNGSFITQTRQFSIGKVVNGTDQLQTGEKAVPTVEVAGGAMVPITINASANVSGSDAVKVNIAYDDPQSVLGDNAPTEVSIAAGADLATLMVPTKSGINGNISVIVMPTTEAVPTTGGANGSPVYTVGLQNVTLVQVSGGISLAITPATASITEGGNQQFTITLSEAANASFTPVVTLAGDSRAMVSSQPTQINSGQRTSTFTVSTTDNMIDEGNATVFFTDGAVNITATGTIGSNDPFSGTASVTVVDNDPKPNLVITANGNPTDVIEGRNQTFTITSMNNIQFPVDNGVSVGFLGAAEHIYDNDGTRIGGVMAQGVNHDITFPAGATSTTFTVQAFDTRHETLMLTLNVPEDSGLGSGNYTRQTGDSVDLPIRQLGITLAAANATRHEGDDITVTVGLESAQPGPVTVMVRSIDANAMAGVHYTAVDQTLTFNPGDTSKSVTISTMSDNVYRAGSARSFRLRATATIEGDSQANQTTLAVDDIDPLPVVVLTGPSGVLGGANATYTLTYPNTIFGSEARLQLQVRGNAVEYIYHRDGAAANTPVASGTNTSNIGQNSNTNPERTATIVVQTRSGVTNPDPIVVELIADANTYTRSTTANTVTTTVTDTGIAFTEATKIINEGETDTVTIALNSAQNDAVTVNYRIEGETAVAGEEFTAMNGSVEIPAGNTNANITVNILDDMVSFAPVGNDERTLRVFANATISGTTTSSSIQVRISEQDPLTNLELVAPATARPGETVTFTIRNTNNIVSGNQISFAVAINGSFTAARARLAELTPTDPSDPMVSLSVALEPRQTEASFEVDVARGSNLNNITARITSSESGYTRTNNVTHVEVRSLGISFDPATLTVPEPTGDREVTLNLTRIAQSLATPTRVEIVTSDGTALAGTHYQAINRRTFTYEANNDTLAVPITILDNNVDDMGGLSFMVNATTSNLEGSETFTAQMMVTISPDNDEPPTLAIRPPNRIAPGRNGTVRIESNRTVSPTAQQVMIQVNGSFDYVFNATHRIDNANMAQPIVVAQNGSNGSATFGVTLPPMARSVGFTIQAAPQMAGGNFTPITVGFASTQPNTNITVNPTVAQNVTIPVRAGFNVGALTETILPQIAVGLLDEVTGAISARTHQAFGDASDGGWLPPFPRRIDGGGGNAGNAGFSINGQSLADYAKNFARSEAAREAAENPWDDPTSRRLTELPSVNSLALTLRQGESSGSVGVWAEGFTRNIDGTQNGIKFDGEIPGAVLGVDARLTPNLLAGIGFSQATGDFEYSIVGEDERGTYEADLTGFHPYIGYRTETGGNVWASLGIGEGEVTVAQQGLADNYVGEVEFQNYGLGFTSLGDSRLDGSESIALNIHGDINFATIEESPTARTRASFPGAGSNELSVGRTRIGATVSKDTQLAGGGSFRQSLDLALRHDSGDIAEGGAIELGGALGLQAASGLSLDLSARTLLSHEESIDDWGIKGGLRWTSRAFSGVGRGLQLVLAPEWGNSASQSDQLLDGGIEGIAGYTPTTATTTDSNEADSTTRYNFDVRYGIAIFREGLLTPFVKGDANDAATTQYGSAFSFGDFEAGASSAINEDNAFIRYQRDF